MNVQGFGAGVQEDINRISVIWRDCRARYGSNGPYLFGGFSIADAMFGPVVSRFVTSRRCTLKGESTLRPNIHVIGDAALAGAMPRSVGSVRSRFVAK